MEGAIFCKMTREGLADEVTFEKGNVGSALCRHPGDLFQMEGIVSARVPVYLAHSRISRAQCGWQGVRDG